MYEVPDPLSQDFQETKKFKCVLHQETPQPNKSIKNNRKNVNSILCSLQHVMKQNVFLVLGK